MNLLKAQREEHEQDCLVTAQSVEKESLTEQDPPKTTKPKTLKERNWCLKTLFLTSVLSKKRSFTFQQASTQCIKPEFPMT